jgi:hypothetical protein
MTDHADRERESAATEQSRWDAAGEEEARRRHEAAERLKAEQEELERRDSGDEAA